MDFFQFFNWFLLAHTGQVRPTDLHHLLEGVQVLLHAIVESQVGHKVAGEHPIEPVEQRVDAGVQVDQVDHWDLTWRRPAAGESAWG